MSEIALLGDGRRVKYALKRRDRDPYYLACFRGPDGKRKERSTQEPNRKRAAESAVALIVSEFEPRTLSGNPTWDEAIERMIAHMRGANLRPATIKSYYDAVKTLREVHPRTHGPGEVTQQMAELYKLARLRAGKKPVTVKGDLNELSIVFDKWWVRTCKLLDANPFGGVEPPKTDKPEPRVLTPVERQAFLDFLATRWDGWRLPLLFLEVKGRVGCRIHELAALPSDRLEEGRLRFDSTTAKGRKTRRSKLPAALYAELRDRVGSQFVWERFSEELRAIHRDRGRHDHAASVKDFSPERLVAWMEDEAGKFRVANPQVAYFKLHNLRGTAMSLAKSSGVGYDEAAIAFGCHPETMRKHYIRLDETAIADAVMDRMNGAVADEGAPDVSKN